MMILHEKLIRHAQLGITSIAGAINLEVTSEPVERGARVFAAGGIGVCGKNGNREIMNGP